MAELAPEAIFEQDIRLEDLPSIYEIPDSPESFPEGSAIFLHQLPEFQFTARRSRQKAESIRNERMEQLRNGEFDAVPMPIDFTGSARRAVVAERKYGLNSSEAITLRYAVQDDAERQVAETVTKMTYGYFDELVQLYDPEQGGLTAHGQLMLDIAENGISPMLDPEDTQRAVNDYVGQSLDEIFLHSEHADDYVLIAFAECADWAIKQYGQDQDAGITNKTYGGLVPENEKLMVQKFEFNREDGERTLEQVGLPGTFIDRGVIHEFLYSLNLLKRGEVISKAELQGARIMVHKGVISSVLDATKLLDMFATEKHGVEIMMGEEKDNTSMITYDDIPTEAIRRDMKYQELTQNLVDKMLELERSGVDKWQTERHVTNYVDKELHKIVRSDPEQARRIFNNSTAEGYIRVQALTAAGRYDEAQILEEQVFRAAPAPSSCGAGSCGLEGLNEKTSQFLRKELGGKEGDTVLKDKVRSCPGCGEKNLVYVFNSKEVRTKCLGCKDENLKKAA